ncbi:MAG: phasin family protein [Alphaproteobacteria bacterium]
MSKSSAPFGPDAFKAFSDFKIPGVNIDALVAYHRKNFDAISKANQATVKGFQSVAQRQSELFRAAIEGATKVGEALVAAKSPEDRMRKQAEFAKEGVMTAMSNAQEMAGIVTGAATEAAGVLNARLVESIDEVRELFAANGAAH